MSKMNQARSVKKMGMEIPCLLEDTQSYVGFLRHSENSL